MRAEHIKTSESPYGSISFYSDDEYIGRVLASDAVYCPAECELMERLLHPGDKVIEGGANIGAITLALARAVGPQGRVMAFEPQSENYILLERNILDNGLDQIESYDCALGAEFGHGTVSALDELGHHNYGHVVLNQGSRSVNVRTIDGLFPKEEIALIKLDIEGSEAEALRGARQTIDRCRPLLYVENDKADKVVELSRLIRSLNYRCYHHIAPIAPATSNVRDNGGHYIRDISAINLLCVPSERLSEFSSVVSDLRPAIPESPRLGRSGWAGVARLGGIGDNLIAASVLRPLRSAGYKIDVITSLPQGVVFENNPFIDKLSIKAPKDMPTDQKQWQTWFRSRGAEYDTFANLSHSCEISLAMVPIQTQVQWPSKMRRKYYGHNYLEFVHDVLDMPYEFGPLFFPTEEERDHAIVTKRKLGSGPIVGWALNGSRIDKTYPKTPIAIARLIKELDVQVVMFGAPTPYPDYQVAKQTQEHVINQNGSDKGLHLAMSSTEAPGAWPIRRALTQLGHCDIVIGPDTGQMWAVAFEKMPKIMLHSHASVNNIVKHWVNTVSLHANPERVPCWPCHLLHDTVDTCLEEQRRHGMSPDPEEKGAACIQTISVEDIVNSVRKVLS